MASNSNKGFTLLEILIAITLLAFISLAVVNITDNALLTKERTTEVNKNNLQIETAMSRFDWDLTQIYSPLYFSTVMKIGNSNALDASSNLDALGNPISNISGGAAAPVSPELQNYYEQLVRRFERNEHFISVSKEGLPIPRFYAPERNVFEFFTTSNRRKVENSRQSHFAWVRYTLGDQPDVPEEDKDPNVKMPTNLKALIRYYNADDPYSDKRLNTDDEERVKGAILLNNVEKLEFQYWDLNRRKWETSLRNIQQGESIIRGVKILITWYDSQGHKRTATRIFRTHWPLVVPVDQAMPTTGVATNGGTNAGTTTGVNSGF